ncbi:MAG: MATE family efflux transporter [Lachnospiraceae bacterium]|jgi:putative MATE family efflux protein|nr:MATE family efflux transporter [Lachnospiraceae bacterium]MCI9624037.1 MATE family efflux transporter [Lachnospiraceae bacterium]
MTKDLTHGPITKTMLLFAVPMILGNLLQQLYNVADTLIVGQFLGPDALAAVGSSYTLMTFLTSILLGLCMGSGAVFSIRCGEQNQEGLKISIVHSFVMIAALSIILNILVFVFIDPILHFLKVPDSIYGMMRSYLWIIFYGITATFFYNFFASLLRAVGNSVTPLLFLGICALLNIVLDLLFVIRFHWGAAGAAAATVIAQYVSGLGLFAYTFLYFPEFRFSLKGISLKKTVFSEIARFSSLTCLQQSVMNLGILMVQGLVNSFGPAVMAAFAAAVKIDSFAYMPVQDFGNAFSTFTAQNFGAKKQDRIRAGMKSAVFCSVIFCLLISLCVFLFARPLMLLFVKPSETTILSIGIQYLRIEGSFYFGIGCLFLLYGFYRAVERPGMSVVLTIISLGTRVLLAYILSAIPAVGVAGIWWSVPIGWILADLAGFGYLLFMRKRQR